MSVSDSRKPTAARPDLAGDLRVALGRLNRRLREESQFGDLTWSQTKVLVRLDRDGPATVTTLAQAEGVRPQSMGATVAALKDQGFISGAPDPADGRQTLLSLTPVCREKLAAVRTAKRDWLQRAIDSKLAAVERDDLAAAIMLLERLADS